MIVQSFFHLSSVFDKTSLVLNGMAWEQNDVEQDGMSTLGQFQYCQQWTKLLTIDKIVNNGQYYPHSTILSTSDNIVDNDNVVDNIVHY